MFLHDMMLLGGQSAPYVAENRSTTNNLGSTSQPVNISSRTLVGDLLVAMVGGEADRIYTWPAGWTELADEVNGTSSSATVAYKVAESSDIGSSITVSSSGTSQKSASFCLSIRGAWALPNISTVAVGTSTSPDPNSLTYNVSRQKLWLAMTGGRLNSDLVGSGGTWLTPPTGYTRDTWAAVTSSGVGAFVGVATLSSSLNTQDPSSFSIAVSGSSPNWLAWTVVV